MFRWKSIKNFFKKVSEPRWIFLIISASLGALVAFTVPSLWGFDETSHFARVYMLSEGKFLPSQKAEMPANFNKIVWYAVADIGEEKQQDIFIRKDINNPLEYGKMLKEKFSAQQESAINPAGYSVVAYPLSVIAVAFTHLFDVSIGATILIARLAGLMTFILLVHMALYVLHRNGFKKVQWLVVCISLLPTTLFQAATLSADTIINGLAILFVALLIVTLKCQRDGTVIDRRYIAALTVISVLLPLIKVNYVFISMGIIFVTGSLIGGKKLSALLKGVVLIGSVALSLYLSFGMAPGTTTQSVSPRPDGQSVSQVAQAKFVMHHPIDFLLATLKSLVSYGDAYIKEMTTTLAWNYVNLPLIFTIICIILILTAAFYARDEIIFMKKYFTMMTTFSLLGIGSIFLALYLAFTPVGKMLVDGVQGRYMIPFIMPIVATLAISINIRFLAKDRLMNSLMASSLLLITLGSILYYIKATY